MRRKPLVSIGVLAYGLAAHLYSLGAAVFSHSSTDVGIGYLPLFLVCSALLAVAAFSVTDFVVYRLILCVHALVLLLGRPVISSDVIAEATLVSAFLLSVAVYEGYPLNLALCLIFSTVSIVSRPFMSSGDTSLSDVVESAGIGLWYAIPSVVASLFTRHRQKLIEAQEQVNRLEQAIGELSQVNREYQDYLLKVEAESKERERKRITSDIHDIVGYTLTNNIMLMEAATDVARSNPIRVTRLLNTARENAQEGLERIRESLYLFRQDTDYAPYGLAAIAKLIETFGLATGITVEAEYGNAPRSVNSDVDAAVYHVVQESMVNSLRHGRASRICVVLQSDGRALHVDVRDNGTGNHPPDGTSRDGIGLTGMSERVERLGGVFEFGNVTDGYRISATIPLDARSDRHDR